MSRLFRFALALPAVNLFTRVASAAAVSAAILGLGVTPASAGLFEPPPHQGSSLSTPTTFKGKVRAQVLASTVSIANTSDVNLSGWIDFFNASSSPTKVTVSFAAKLGGGSQGLHKENEIVSVAAKSHLTIPTAFEDLGLTPGDWELAVFIKPGRSITVERASQTVLALDSDMPNGSSTLASGDSVSVGATPTTVLSAIVDNGSGDHSGPYLTQGWLNVVGGHAKTAVTLDYYMDHQLMGSVTQIVGPDQPVSIPFGFFCDGAFTGNHEFAVQASSAGGVSVARSGFLSAALITSNGSMVIAGLSGGGNAVPLTTKPHQVLSTPFSTKDISDVWMGGWLTLENTSAKKRTVTVQAAMDGEAEGPALAVTVPAHGKINVPFGLLCNGEPAGDLILSVMVTASGSGVQWNGDGHLSAWSIPSAP